MWPQQRIVEVADGILVVLNGKGQMGVSNASCVIEDGKAFVVDTMTFPAMAEGMVREIVGEEPMLILYSTHITISIISEEIRLSQMLVLSVILRQSNSSSG